LSYWFPSCEKRRFCSAVGPYWEIRVGIHSGDLVAGVVGREKFSYDVWGDMVNTASRLESSGVTGRINISGATHGLVKDFFDCEFRGKVAAKHKGEIDMYFVNRIRRELAIDAEGRTPNEGFLQLYSLLGQPGPVGQNNLLTVPMT
jgi:adenylate cyclase